MRTRLIAMGLLAVALHGCGGGDTTTKEGRGRPPAATGPGPAALLVGAPDGAVVADGPSLAKLGIRSAAVVEPQSVGALREALAALRRRPDVDPARIAVVAEGSAATLAAKLVADDPKVAVAVLGDAARSAARPLSQRRDARILLQRGQDSGDVTAAAEDRLVEAAPAGTLLYQHKSLAEAGARRERDRWLRSALRS